jgi:hypothetical protein
MCSAAVIGASLNGISIVFTASTSFIGIGIRFYGIDIVYGHGIV